MIRRVPVARAAAVGEAVGAIKKEKSPRASFLVDRGGIFVPPNKADGKRLSSLNSIHFRLDFIITDL